MQIGQDRLFPAVRNRQAGTAVVACGFSCRHQLADGADTKAIHWVESIQQMADYIQGPKRLPQKNHILEAAGRENRSEYVE